MHPHGVLIWILKYVNLLKPKTSQVALVVKNTPASAGDARDIGSIPGWGRSPGEGNGNPLQYSCLENPMDRGAWWATVRGVAESDTKKLMHLEFHKSWATSPLPPRVSSLSSWVLAKQKLMFDTDRIHSYVTENVCLIPSSLRMCAFR